MKSAIICANMIRCMLTSKDEAIDELQEKIIELKEKVPSEILEKKITRNAAVLCCSSISNKGTQGMIDPTVTSVERVISRRDKETQTTQEEEMEVTVTTYTEGPPGIGSKEIEKDVEEALYRVLKKIEEEKTTPVDTSNWSMVLERKKKKRENPQGGVINKR